MSPSIQLHFKQDICVCIRSSQCMTKLRPSHSELCGQARATPSASCSFAIAVRRWLGLIRITGTIHLALRRPFIHTEFFLFQSGEFDTMHAATSRCYTRRVTECYGMIRNVPNWAYTTPRTRTPLHNAVTSWHDCIFRLLWVLQVCSLVRKCAALTERQS